MPAKIPKLRVTQINIRNLLGIEERTITPAKITLFSGENGSGKSSVLKSIQAALKRGSLVKLKNIHAAEDDASEIVLDLEDGHEAFRVRRADGDVEVKKRVGTTAGYETVPRPGEWLRAIYDPAANPIAFDEASSDKERILLLLEALPLQMERAELLAAMCLTADEIPPVPETVHPLEQCDLIRDAIFRRRTGLNVDASGKRKSAEQLRREIPAEEPADLAAQQDALQDEVSTLAAGLARAEQETEATERSVIVKAKAEHAAAEQRIRADLRARTVERKAAHEAKAAEIRAAAEKRIAGLAGEMSTEVEAWEEAAGVEVEAADSALATAQQAAEEYRAGAQAELKAQREALTALREQLHEVGEQRRTADRHRTLHQEAEKFDEQATLIEAEAGRLTRAISGLDVFRAHLSNDLPIDGLSIEGGELRRHGVLYEQLNDGQRLEVAVDVAVARAGACRLPAIFIDGVERLDSKRRLLLIEELLKRPDIMVFMGRVADGDPTVETFDPPEPAPVAEPEKPKARKRKRAAQPARESKACQHASVASRVAALPAGKSIVCPDCRQELRPEPVAQGSLL